MNSPRHNIFISYTHTDNRPLWEGQKGWIELFHSRLLNLIEDIYENQIGIIRDPKLRGNDIINKTLRLHVDHSKILVTILSPKYLKSRWCLRELRWFSKSMKSRAGDIVDTQSSIFRVEKTKTTTEKQPRIIRGTRGYKFYHYNDTTGLIEHFRHDPSVPYDPRYWEVIDNLAQDIVKMLENIFDKRSEARLTPAPEKVVYLAEPTTDLEREHKKIKDELKARHYNILPEEPLPHLGPSQLSRFISDKLAGSRLSIHLVGKDYLELPETERARSIIRLQSDLAAERLRGSNFSRLIWVPDGIKLTDAQQLELVGYGNKGSLKGTEFIQSPLDELKAVTLEKLESGEAHRPLDSATPSYKTIYLVYDKQDIEDIDSIHSCLFERGYEVATSSFEDDTKTIERHKSKFANCDAVLIYYGKGNQDWVESNLDYLETVRGIKSIAESKFITVKPLLAKAIYVAPPFRNHKRIFKTRRAEIIKGDEDFDCAHLDNFFAQIEERLKD
jgi:TIR domain